MIQDRERMNRARNENGFTYLMVLVAVVVLGILVEAATFVTSRVQQAEREAELLFRGRAYMNAIKSYYESSPSSLKTFPRNLEDLVQDPRSAHKRHLRALYPEPFGGEWTLIPSSDGGIAGVASSATAAPLKRSRFPHELQTFEAANSYAEWIFQYVPKQAAPPPRSLPPQTAPRGPAVRTVN